MALGPGPGARGCPGPSTSCPGLNASYTGPRRHNTGPGTSCTGPIPCARGLTLAARGLALATHKIFRFDGVAGSSGGWAEPGGGPGVFKLSPP